MPNTTNLRRIIIGSAILTSAAMTAAGIYLWKFAGIKNHSNSEVI